MHQGRLGGYYHQKTVAPVKGSHNYDAATTITVAVEATTFEATFRHMTSTLGNDAIFFLDRLIDVTTFNALNAMGYGPPIVQLMEGETKICSQHINRNNFTLKVQIRRILYLTVPAVDADSGTYDKALVPDASTVDVATLSIFINPNQRSAMTRKLRELMPGVFGALDSISFDNFIAESAESDNNSITCKDEGHATGGHHYSANDPSSASALPSLTPSAEPSTEPSPFPSIGAPPTFLPSATPTKSAIDLTCNTKAFVEQGGGVSMGVVYHYELFWKNGADVQKDATELDEKLPEFLRNLFMLTCEEEDGQFAVGGLSSQRSAGDDVEGLFWIDQGYPDAPNRSGECTSKARMTTGDYSLGCTPMIGAINVFFMSSADAEKVKAQILQSMRMKIFETTRKSWAVYVGEHPIVDSSSTGIVAGATVSSRGNFGSWTEQTVGNMTVKSILIYIAVAVFAAIGIIGLAVLFKNTKRKRRNRMESQKMEQLQKIEQLENIRRARDFLVEVVTDKETYQSRDQG